MEVGAQSIRGESWPTVRMQMLLKFMDQMIGIGSPASSQVQSGQRFTHRVNRQPQPARFFRVFPLVIEFIHLNEVEIQIEKRLGMELSA